MYRKISSLIFFCYVDKRKYVRYIKNIQTGCDIIATYIKGIHSKTIFKNNTTGYHIGLLKVAEVSDETLSDYLGKTITFTGYFHELNDIDTYIMYGKLVEHSKYGKQFQVDSYERCKPVEKDSIVEFLTSGLFKGIGEKKAKSIVDVLGKDTLKIILETPDNLLLIPKITKKDIDVLHNKLKEYETSYETIVYLQELGFNTKDSMLIYNKYQKGTKLVIEEDIYQIIDEIIEINFKKVDIIAIRKGIEKDSKIRIKAALLYIMQEISNTYGHCYYYDEELVGYLPRVLGIEIEEDKYIKALKELITDNKIIIKEERIYLSDMYHAEAYITKRLRSLSKNEDKKSKKIEQVIEEIEEFYEIKYNKEQLDAIKTSYIKDLLIITGGPGTGKTTIMHAICEVYRRLNNYTYEKLQEKIALLAPTGRAAKRMTEKTNVRASTIHRFLKWQKETNKFQVNEYNKSKVEFVIIDESSMIDTYLMDALLKGISANCKILIVGDDEQLPSVGPGQVLYDLISSNQLPVIKLTELYRQEKDSNIINLAYDIRNNTIREDIFNKTEDLTFIKCLNNEVIDNIKDLVATYNDLSYKDIQILAPVYKGLNGIDEINKQIQVITNPKSNTKEELKVGEVLFRENDKVIQLTNMPDENVYNGDIGIIDSIVTNNKKEITIDFDNNYVKYTPSNFNKFRLAYSISIHKSQGSEFKVVIIPIIKTYYKMLYKKLIYTAVTRAKEKLYLIGDFDALRMAANNNEEIHRRTSIKEMLVKGIK